MDNFSLHEFQFNTNDPNGQPGPWTLTSIVMSEEEFNSFIDFMVASMVDTYGADGVRVQREQIESLRGARHIPMIARGTKTETAFKKYGIRSNFMSVIVRGEGLILMEKLTRGQARGQA